MELVLSFPTPLRALTNTNAILPLLPYWRVFLVRLFIETQHIYLSFPPPYKTPSCSLFPNSHLHQWQNSCHLIYYSTQVVAGTNYFLVYKWRPAGAQQTQYRCFVVWKRLPGQTPAYKITKNYDVTTDNAQACKDCHAVGNSCLRTQDKKTLGTVNKKGMSDYLNWIGGKRSRGDKPLAKLNGKI